MKFDVIMFNMSNYSEWDEGVSNRNYHVLQELLTRPEIGKILAVDYLPLTFKRALRIFKEDLVLNIAGGQVIKRGLFFKLTKVSEKLYVYTDTSFWWQPKNVLKNIKKAAINLHFGDFVVWSFFPFVGPYLKNLGQKLTVFEAVDNWLLHSSYTKQKNKLTAAYKIVKDEADLIFVVSENLLNFFEDQPNVYWIPNGVDIKHYTKKFPLINRDIADLKKPIIGYIGVIQEKVDLDLVEYLAQKNQDKSIVLVGPVWNEQDTSRQKLEKYTNIYFLGYKKYSEAPMYIQQFDIGIIPHKQTGFASSTNPMKTYEYLACGLPVVASQNIGTENTKDMIAVAQNKEDFNLKIDELLKNNSAEDKLKRQEFVRRFSWHNTVNKMLDLIANKLN